MARPRKNDEERRSECFAIRLTPDERLSLIAEAERLEITPTELARQRLIKGRVVVHEHRKLDPRQAFELGRIGVNLNQIARALNSGQNLNPATIDGAIGEVRELIATLLRPENVTPKTGGLAEPAPARPTAAPVPNQNTQGRRP